MEKIITNIKNGNFNKKLNLEYKSNLRNIKEFDKKNNSSNFYKTLLSINKILKMKKLFLTGGTSGIGYSILEKFSNNGWKIYSTFNKNKPQTSLLKKEISKL